MTTANVTPLPAAARQAAHERARAWVASVDHVANLTETIRRMYRVLECESTPSEVGALITRDQASVLRDVRALTDDLLRAIPAIKPAKDWRTPTEVRRNVTSAIAARTEPAITRRPRRRR
jgi:hypothetical protein